MLPEHLIPDCINTHGPRKSSFNSKERKAIRLFLTLRDGNICKICGLPAADGESLDIDHIDGNKENPHHTNLQQAQGYGHWAQGQDPAVLDQWPAQELIRVQETRVQRDWAARWASAGGTFFDGRMIALKNDPIWRSSSGISSTGRGAAVRSCRP